MSWVPFSTRTKTKRRSEVVAPSNYALQRLRPRVMPPAKYGARHVGRALPRALGRQYGRPMMRVTLSLLLMGAIVGITQSALAKYVPPQFFVLAGQSDAVVLGEITAVGDTTFALRPDEVLAGNAIGSSLMIVQFENWTCSHRWKPYAVGQREVAFLYELPPDRAHATGARYGLQSAGDEGEWEIRGDRISVQGYRVPGGIEFDDGEHPGQWLPLRAVLDALRTYRQCFSVSPHPLRYRWPIVRVLCDKPALDDFRARSSFHEYLTSTSLDAAEAVAMRRWVYGDAIPELSREEVGEAIVRGDPEELVIAVSSAALYASDAEWAEGMCRRLASHENAAVRGGAILGLGWVARLHKRLDRPTALPIIQAGLTDSDDSVRRDALTAADDVETFLGWAVPLRSVALPPGAVAPGVTELLTTPKDWEDTTQELRGALPAEWRGKRAVVIGPPAEPISCEASEYEIDGERIIVRMLHPSNAQPIAGGGCAFLVGDGPAQVALAGYWQGGFYRAF